MSFSQEWERIHSERDWGKYPNEHLVAFTMKTFSSKKERSKISVLDLGFGGGGNLKFFCEQGFNVAGVEGSISAHAKTRNFLSGFGYHPILYNADMTDLSMFPDMKFDLVTDIRSMSNMPITKLSRVVSEIYRILVPGGFFLTMLYGKGCMSYERGQQVEPGTFSQVPDGPLAGLGPVSIFDIREVRSLLRSYSIVKHHQITEKDISGDWKFEDHWVVCRKV